MSAATFRSLGKIEQKKMGAIQEVFVVKIKLCVLVVLLIPSDDVLAVVTSCRCRALPSSDQVSNGRNTSRQLSQLEHIPRLDVPGAWLADCSADRKPECSALMDELSEHRDVSAISAAIG